MPGKGVVAVLDPERAMVVRSDDGNWVWEFGLYPTAGGGTRLVSRNRIAVLAAGSLQPSSPSSWSRPSS
jgi:hypothetical protein